MSAVFKAARLAWKPQDLRTPWEWCEDHITVDNTSPMPGKWRSANSPWVREVMEAKADRAVQTVAVKCSAQSSKTQTVLNLLCYDIAEDPGPTMYVLANADDAGDFVRDRFAPTLALCKPANDALLRQAKLAFTFSTMPLYFVGAGSPAKLQGKPIKRLYLDEVRNYPTGALNTVLKRVRAFGQLAQIFIISTPGVKGDDVDRAFLNGDQRTPHFPCPACGHIQQLRFAQLKWDTNETTRPEGHWDYDRLAESIRFECEQCKHPIRDTPTERKLICRTTRFIRMNPSSPSNHVSFTWNALLPWWVPFRSIVEEFLKARQAARMGDIEPMKTFVTETLGESWEDQLGVIDEFEFLESRKQDYDFGERWPEELARFMAADRQQAGGENYRWVIRAFGAFGKSRLIAYGRCNSKAELEETRKRYGVKANNAIIDTGFAASELYQFCLSTGWKAFKGDDCEYFLFREEKTQRTIRRIWDVTAVDVFFGKRGPGMRPVKIKLFRFSNNATKDLLATFMRGIVGDWSLPRPVAMDFLKELTAERREEVTNSSGHIKHVWKQVRRDNHWLDCELMILVAAVITKLVAAPLEGGKPNVPAKVGGGVAGGS